MKKIFLVLTISMLLISNVFAAKNHPQRTNKFNYTNNNYIPNMYLGANVGWSRDGLRTGTGAGIPGVSVNRNGVTAGALIGYNFNRYLAAELAYQYFQGVRIKFFGASAREYTNMVALYARGNLPVYKNVDLFLKFGPAWVNTHEKAVLPLGTVALVATNSVSNVRPVIATGLQYRIPNTNIGIEAQYTHLFRINDSAEYDAVTGGLNYYFT